ncbi:DISARM system helicase DrmA [Paenarthrobacter nitroguajacolicus]|uniref:DISARM system helicase DrmA n=1 Tax=Paenarthrobacter nitroguajacolicus TaxID=211146 RepID=UPI003AE9AD86
MQNAWMLAHARGQLDGFTIVLDEVEGGQQIQMGDGVALSAEGAALAVGRVYRVKETAEGIVLHLDQLVPATDSVSLADLGVEVQADSGATRLEWDLFEEAVVRLTGDSFGGLPTLSGKTKAEQAYLRELLRLAVVDDLLGPADGPHEEIVGMSVRDRYLVGKLAPLDPVHKAQQESEFAEEEVADGDTPEDLRVYGNEAHISRDSVPATSPAEEDDEPEVNASESQSLVPSSMGLTFCVPEDQEAVEVLVSWGRYIRSKSEDSGKRCWKRIPAGGKVTLALSEGSITPCIVDNAVPEVRLQGSVSRHVGQGDRLVTLFLVNGQTEPQQNRDQAWVFQPEIVVRDNAGGAVFRRRPLLDVEQHDEERLSLEMIYRRRVEFATGHGTSVHAVVSASDPELSTEIRTAVIPDQEIQITEAPGADPADRVALRELRAHGWLDMEKLADSAELSDDKLLGALTVLTGDYEGWIAENRAAIGVAVEGYDAQAQEAMERCELILERLKEGISMLRLNTDAMSAFRFANRAMAQQRVRGIYARKRRQGEAVTVDELNIPANRTWHPFQLAFLLLSVPALADPEHADRTEPLAAYADLLWFPTGGGKTEAYLGVAAFAMSIRRLQGMLGGVDATRGLAVIMRYTLRLLTLQQFQRASTLICAMEVLRKQDPETWGSEPFTLGLWVGGKVTPNRTEDSHEAIEKERDNRRDTGSSPAQLTSCPWCGSAINPGRDITVEKYPGADQTFIYCSDKYGRCEFSKAQYPELGLPVVVVDEEIYRRPPSMLIATVDKFAMMAWRGQTRTLFGAATSECPRHGLLWPGSPCQGNHKAERGKPATRVKVISPLRPPDLIIQDEFHLISGPLGTMVGVYETAVDELSTWSLGDKKVRPKVIASTATVRKAEEQVNNVFLRQVAIFPPHGLDVEDNFFSVQRSTQDRPGRLYLGICSPGSSRPAVLIRVYVALLTAAKTLFQDFGAAADPYMTLVGYFNSLRELGGMRRLAEDDVQTRAYRVEMSDVSRPGLTQRSVNQVDELTSRVTSKEIPQKLDRLELPFKEKWESGEARAYDIVLATNMLSVGVDVNRLGLMVVNGQPKNTAEYIQATSRVGRSFPGLVVTVLTWSRPRDLSHYETFEHYHSTFYKHVEAQSVTPFAPRALDRALTGTMVSLMRLGNDSLNPNLGAQLLDKTSGPEATRAIEAVSERAWKAKDKAARDLVLGMARDRTDRWAKEAAMGGRRLGYETERGQGDVVGLLRKPGAQAWDEFTVLMSMREVEPGVQLLMDASRRSADAPPWKPRSRPSDGGAA